MKYLVKIYDKNARKTFNFEYDLYEDAIEQIKKSEEFGNICELYEIRKIEYK